MNKDPKESFHRWFLMTQFTQEKRKVWQSFFMNNITIALVVVYCIQILMGNEIPQGFDLLLGMVLGFYFKQRVDSGESEDVK